jgi:RNA polymerase sigma factor for flagellar operon FliA
MASTKRKRTSSSRQATLSLAEMPIEDVWREYRLTRSDRVRNFITEKYRDVVVRHAQRAHRKLPAEVEVDDLISVGMIGMMEAIDTFDVDRNIKFETFCTQRIRGAIIDELRSLDWVPRLVRARAGKVDKARRVLEAKIGRPPTDAELRARLNLDEATFEKFVRDSKPAMMGSLDRPIRESDSSRDVREIDVFNDARQENPLRQMQKRDLKHVITRDLSRAEQLIVILYYYEEMTMKEIGLTLDLSESRVSQMHSSIVARLKAQMQHRVKEL